MSMPNDTPIAEMAKRMGVSAEEIEALPDDVQRLTKGDLLELWGAKDGDEAVALWQGAAEGRSIPSPSSLDGWRYNHLTLGDIGAVQALWSGPRVRAALTVRDITTISEVLPRTHSGIANALRPFADAAAQQDGGGTTVMCCCCPCCCAAAELEPAREVA